MHVVLVHGSGGSPSTWSSVVPLLEERGIPVSAVDNPSRSLTEDVARVETVIDSVEEDVLLVGHSYGGAVVTNAGRHPRVRGLVYVAAFVPEEGESVQGIVGRYPAAEVSNFFSRGPAGEWIPTHSEESRQALAWDVPRDVWEAGHHDRRDSGDAIFSERTGAPAWGHLPSWYLLALGDKHIRVEAQRDMAERAGATVIEVDTSHAVPHVAPERVVEVVQDVLRALDPVGAP